MAHRTTAVGTGRERAGSRHARPYIATSRDKCADSVDGLRVVAAQGKASLTPTDFGLGSYIFTTDDEQARRVADRIEAGMVFVNAVGAEGVELPFGGVKRSGFGRELGRYGIDEFVNKKLIRIS